MAFDGGQGPSPAFLQGFMAAHQYLNGQSNTVFPGAQQQPAAQPFAGRGFQPHPMFNPGTQHPPVVPPVHQWFHPWRGQQQFGVPHPMPPVGAHIMPPVAPSLSGQPQLGQPVGF